MLLSLTILALASWKTECCNSKQWNCIFYQGHYGTLTIFLLSTNSFFKLTPSFESHFVCVPWGRGKILARGERRIIWQVDIEITQTWVTGKSYTPSSPKMPTKERKRESFLTAIWCAFVLSYPTGVKKFLNSTCVSTLLLRGRVIPWGMCSTGFCQL